MKFSGKWNWRSMSLPPLILIALSGCAHVSTTPPATNSYCSIAKPISYNSKIDRPETVAQIEAHNSVWVCLCEDDCPHSGKQN